MQRYPLDIWGNGFCFIYSLMESLSHDHKITLEFNHVFHLILDHIYNENEKYLNFYTKRAAHSFVTTSDLMMKEVICFFDFGNFNVNVDLLIQIAADALNLRYIYHPRQWGYCSDSKNTWWELDQESVSKVHAWQQICRH